MTAISDIGITLEVTPEDEIWIQTSAEVCEYVRDFLPFRMCVNGLLNEHDTLFGVFGPVIGGAPRYHGLIANLLVRLDDSDWRHDQSTQANFKVGPTLVHRVREFDFRDPRGTKIEGFPVIGRFGRVRIISAKQDAEPIKTSID